MQGDRWIELGAYYDKIGRIFYDLKLSKDRMLDPGQEFNRIVKYGGNKGMSGCCAVIKRYLLPCFQKTKIYHQF